MKRSAGKAKANMAAAVNAGEQVQDAAGQVDALQERANDIVQGVEEECAELDPGCGEAATEDYQLQVYKEIDTFEARSGVDRGIMAELYSLDGKDTHYGKGVSWLRRWTKLSDEPEPTVPCRSVECQAFTQRSKHADLSKWVMVTNVRFAARPLEIIKSFPNFVDDGDTMVARYPFVKMDDDHQSVLMVSLRAAAMMKANHTAYDIISMSQDSLESLYKMRVAGLNVPADEPFAMDHTIKWLYDFCLSQVQEERDEANDPLNFQFGTAAVWGNTSSPTATVLEKVSLKISQSYAMVCVLLNVALFSVAAYLVCLLAYMLLVPSFPVLILTILALLFAESENALLQCVPLLISVSYVIFVVLYGGILYGIFTLCLWVPTCLLSAGFVRLIIRIGGVRSLFRLGDAQIAYSRRSISAALASLNWSLTTIVEQCSRRRALLIRAATRSSAIVGQSFPQLRRSFTETLSLSNTFQSPSEVRTSLDEFGRTLAHYTLRIIQALKHIIPQRLCEHAKYSCIAICCVMFLTIVLLCITWSRPSQPETVSISQISKSLSQAAECLATCAPRWVTGSPTLCSCFTQQSALQRQSRVWLRGMMDYLLPPDQ